jgi:single-strand DNA-binding protein
MPSLNRVEIIGHIGRDPETRRTPNGTAVCKFSVATSERWTDKASGEKKEHTEWHGVQAWGKQAEICDEYVAKGMLVYVSGSLRTNEWEDKEGVRRSRTEINADKVLFLSKTEKRAQQQDSPAPDDDDIPF